jgi:hypothetical protein
MDTRRGAATSPALLLLFAVAIGIAGWNYHRNLEAERAELRPYRGYAEADLDALVEAYSAHSEASEARWEATSERRAAVREKAYLDEKVAEFERVQAVARGTRETRQRWAEAQATLSEIEKEKRRRAAERDAWRVHLRRLTTVR